MIYSGINIFLPTYKRPQRLLRHLTFAIKFADKTDRIKYSFLVNTEDVETLSILMGHKHFDYQVIHNKTVGGPHLAKFYNQIYEESAWRHEPEYLVSMVGDDMVWETKGYDTAILNAINNAHGIGVVCCEDALMHSRKRTVNAFMGRPFVEATGEPFMCELFPADYIDDIWGQIAISINGLHYLDKVILRHEHNCTLPADKRDETCRRLRAIVGEARKHKDEIPGIVERIVTRLRARGAYIE